MFLKNLIRLTIIIGISSCAELQQAIQQAAPLVQTTPLTQTEVIRGLRTALNKGVDSAVMQLAVKNGFYGNAMYKLLLPPEANSVIQKIQNLPGGKALVDETILAINRSAEAAVPAASSIFIQAISNMSISDGFAILNGGNNAATNYLQTHTSASLTQAFKPIIQPYLKKEYIPGVSAESAYAKLIQFYNTASVGGVLWPEIKQNSLSEYTTQKSIEAVYSKIAVEEQLIRTQASHRVEDILVRVFGR